MENVFNTETPPVEQPKEETLSDKITKHQEKWNAILNDLNSKLNKIAQLPELLNTIYAKRQDAVDYYYSLLNMMAGIKSIYSKRYAEEYNSLKMNAQIRYSTESAINAQINANLSDIRYNMELIDIHTRYMRDTIQSIDDLIYGINNRIRVQELMEGVKK
jgi:hypothetical protein